MGVTGTITVNLAVVKLGYMLERPSILDYSLYGHRAFVRPRAMSSDNVAGGDNQQETARAQAMKQDPQRLYAEHRRRGDEDIVRPAWRHAEPGRNDLAVAELFCVVTKVPKVEVPVRARALPLPGAILVSAAGYMLGTPSIRRYSLRSLALPRVGPWRVKIRPVRAISRKGH